MIGAGNHLFFVYTKQVIFSTMAVDPTYPLLPVAFFLCAAMMLLVLTTTIARQSWNLGVAALCYAILVDMLIGGINAELDHDVGLDLRWRRHFRRALSRAR